MDRSQFIRLKQLTRELRQNGQLAHHQFVERTQNSDYEVDFYGEVKPFANRVTKLLEEWQALVMEWLPISRPKYVFVPQILDTVDNLTIVSVTAFQRDTRRKRFLNTIKAIDYVLDSIDQQITIPEDKSHS